MAPLRIRLYPDPVLRVRCPRVERFDDELARLVADMVATMHAAPGVGLAAPQVGVEAQVAVVDLSVGEDASALLVLANPEIVAAEGSWLETEGCLSIPEFTETVERPQRIRVRAQDLQGRPFEIEAEEWRARAICHEVDHLAGVLFVDRLKGLKRERARRHLKRLEREQEVMA
jgi:peptide deformylase